MSLIQWTQEQFGTQVIVHDQEHQRIFRLLNELHAQAGGGDRPAIGRQLDALIAFVADHFRSEETNMIRAGYAQLGAHKAEHDKLVRLCLDLQAAFHAGKSEITTDTTAFIRDWLVHHIPNIDRAYGEPMMACGIA